MTAPSPSAARHFTVCVSRVIRAPRERVFEAWLRPEIRRQWWLNHAGAGPTACEIDPRPGGRYTIKEFYEAPDLADYGPGHEWVMDGEFLEIDPPRRLVFTWNVNHRPPIVDNRVTVELREVPGGTEITITHEGLMPKEIRDGTQEGWTTLLGHLDAVACATAL